MSERHPYLDFDLLKSITLITGKMVNETPLRVGVGRDSAVSAAMDAVVIRMRRGDVEVPYIPGSSLKGVFRSYVESLVRAMGREVLSPWEMLGERSDKKALKPCVVSGIFGSPAVASHVIVYDAFPVGEPKMLIKTGVGIDRDFGGVRPGILFTEEFVLPDTVWDFRMKILNIDFPPEGTTDDERVHLLDSLFKTFKSVGFQVGARKSVGAGLVRLMEAHWERYVPRDGTLVKVTEGPL
ncbi:MAG: CRISPR-associated RAMP protein Csx7 [Candidatus Caldarchaeales archaeon]